MKKRIRIAQIGVRHEHADGKMMTLRTMPDEFEIVGVCAESPADRETFGRRSCYDGLRWMSREEILATPDLDAVAVETEMTELVPTAMLCAERGLHMHMDKPGGENLEDFGNLLALCEKKKVILQMAYMFRGNPAIQFCIEAARKGWFGQIFEVYTSMSRARDSDQFRKWLSGYRGGGIFDFGSHLVDIIVSMLGAPERVVSFQQQLDGDGLNDNGHAVLLYPKTIATIQTALQQADSQQSRRLFVSGTNATFELRPLEQEYISYPKFNDRPLKVRFFLREGNDAFAAGNHELEFGPMRDRYIDQLEEFAACVRGEKINPYSFEHEYLVQKTVLAVSGYTKWENHSAAAGCSETETVFPQKSKCKI